MQAEQFIRRHITNALLTEGFPDQVATGAAGYGIEYYQRCSQPSRKGGMFDDCLHFARQWAIGQTTAAERKAGKKKAGQESKSQAGRF